MNQYSIYNTSGKYPFTVSAHSSYEAVSIAKTQTWRCYHKDVSCAKKSTARAELSAILNEKVRENYLLTQKQCV